LVVSNRNIEGLSVYTRQLFQVFEVLPRKFVESIHHVSEPQTQF
jgi:hypothetical protein